MVASIGPFASGDNIRRVPGEMNFRTALFTFDEALSELTYKLDQDVVRKAIKIFEANQQLQGPVILKKL
ncbi:hypothetical protein LTR62_001329 [Meristemomyces frigidus]|uniref:Uncharacterized protein n=1 Tax=Meristemomyces frigidus TaxID=1508187 RepID=A0AAN7YGD4_9PEZI|nr:hypothetical protein LTR62_001329 [Meristemomyces frigidus]